ncbi:putative class VI-like SAM-binding methyltransferase superfamily, isoprenylcysteine carboxyl methyltransferase family protein [Lyophyllum shimeji]|uniref:Protein-S-isoprenylcysteine O-methyltransferase n=1 Tax=Lyophyllum shimeji TaxID=47721 RepID=A0A9P3PEE1_LYOSH|nr:putative class VI-like SAM-binding methyltransferase superfamily, isoprenylcysteine carboxyl methyltransferase family protein [Lyophyllum shimeji]
MASDATDSLEERIRQREGVIKHPLQTIPVATHPTIGNIPNTPLAASVIAFLLGGLFSLGFLLFVIGGCNAYWWTNPQLGFFVAAWAAFHWGEFAVTAGWNLEKCSVDSFLLDNGAMYHIANGAALTEYLVTLYFRPELKAYPYLTPIGIILVILGQALRSTAMIHASTNFSHSVAFQKRQDHRLVTDGVYAWFRHPSYAGFYYWALGTQLVLQNPLTFILFAILLWRFFYYRTRAEEKALIRFFGDDYEKYRRGVGTKIPFVP